jgi:hypothetical protein
MQPALPPGGSYSPLSVADFNGDGNPDLAIVQARQATIFFGNGDGTFQAQPAAQLPLTINDTVLGIAGDLNGDGKPDYLLSDGRVWLNTLPSIVVTPKSISLLSGGDPVAAAVTVTGVKGLLSILSNQLWLSYSNGKISANVEGLKPGIYHGLLGFGATNEFGATVQVTLTVGAPSGAFSVNVVSLGSTPSTVYTGDFNGDGIPDLLTVGSTSFSVAMGDGTGNFGPAMQTNIPMNSSVAVADFNVDGHQDVAIIPTYNPIAPATFQVFFGDGTGRFNAGPSQTLPESMFAPGLATPLAIDFNQDGIPDLFIAGYVLLGDGKGGFHLVPPTFQPQQTYHAVTADFNGDGIPDVAYTGLGGSTFYVLIGDGKGGLELTQNSNFGQQDTLVSLIAAGDWNGDGIVDLAIAGGGSPSLTGLIEILSGKGDGTFVRGTPITAIEPNGISSLVTADFNGDGIADLAVQSLGATTVLLGDGTGGFQPGAGQPVPSGGAVAVADFNLDGRPDIAASGPSGVAILLGGLARPSVTLAQVPPSPFDFGQTVSLVAKVSPDPYGFQAPTGMVQLKDGSTVVANAQLTNGSAYFTTPYVPRSHSFTATYIGDARDMAVAALLTIVETGPPAAIQPVPGALSALVTDLNNNPVAGARVTFSAPASGPGGTFAGAMTAAVVTDSRGIATAPPFTPNGIPGSFIITAATTIGGFTCRFVETN